MVYRNNRFVELHRCSNVPVEKGKIIVDEFLKKKKGEILFRCLYIALDFPHPYSFP